VPGFQEAALAVIGERAVEWRWVEGQALAEAVGGELKLGYGSLVLAACLNQAESGPPSGSLDRLLYEVTLPTMLVLRPDREPAASPPQSGIMVSVSGAHASRAALEVAFSLAERTEDQVHLLHVDAGSRGRWTWRPGGFIAGRVGSRRQDHRAAVAILSQALAMSSAYRVQVHSAALRSRDLELGLRAAAEPCRWAFLGVRPVPTDDGIYYGAAAEALLEGVPDRTVLLTLPG